MTPTHLIIGGGSAGAILAARLSENTANRVLLVEAGPDTQSNGALPDILDTYAGWALNNPDYFLDRSESQLQRRPSAAGAEPAAGPL